MSTALINGKIYTLDQTNTIVQALTIKGSIIAKTGTTKDILDNAEHVGQFDQIIDLEGKTVLPGFVDAHTHLGQIALESLWVNLDKTKLSDEIFDLLKERIENTPKGNWVVGVNYDDTAWLQGIIITKTDLDRLSADHPIFLRRICGHYGVVNSAALKLIDQSWKYVDRNNGVLIEDAVLGFMRIVKPDPELRRVGTYKMLGKVHSLGITSVREILNYHSIRVYQELDENNELGLRIFGYVIVDDLEEYLHDYPDGKYAGNNFHVIGIKILLDGSLGARTAALRDSYYDDADNFGKLLYSDIELKDIFLRAKKLGLSLMVHTLGDRALEQFIRIYRELYYDQIPGNPLGHSVEHVEVIDDDLIKDLKTTGLWVSAQPNFAGRWSGPGALNEQRLGPERLGRCNAYRTLMNNDIPVIFGSDCMPLDPIFGVKSAIFHPVLKQRLEPERVVRAYTQTWFKLLKNEKFGTIEDGKTADLLILNNDPFLIDEQEFEALKVVGTIFNGRLVFNDDSLKNIINNTNVTKELKLIESHSDKFSIHLSAEIDDAGNLILSGQDLGSGVEEYWGDSDYEYWVVVPAAQKLKVLVLMSQYAFKNLGELEQWLKVTGVQYIEVGHFNNEQKILVEVHDEKIIFKSGSSKNRIKLDDNDTFLIIQRKNENEDRLLLLLLQYMFNQVLFKNDSEFMEWLKQNDIEYKFHSYV